MFGNYVSMSFSLNTKALSEVKQKMTTFTQIKKFTTKSNDKKLLKPVNKML